MRNLRKNNGVTLITLGITVLILILVAGSIIYKATDIIKLGNLNKLMTDLELLTEKVNSYYQKYGKIPADIRYTNTEKIEAEGVKNPNDDNIYYILDLSSLENLSLNFGEDYVKGETTDNEDIYIINNKSHTIYFVHGIKYLDKIYYRLEEEYSKIEEHGKIDGSYSITKGVNTPKIDSSKGMELVVYDEETSTWIKDTTALGYSYNFGTGDHKSSNWANAEVTVDGNKSYFVWIPRYAYKITYTDESDHTKGGTIDVVFLKDKTDKYIDENGVEQTAKRVTDGGDPTVEYVVHPSFTKTEVGGVKSYENGEWKEELSGLWIGKFESSRVGATLTTGGTEAVTEGENITQEKVQVVPNVTSWRNIKIGDCFDRAKEYNEDLNSHMLKNSEWGAVAYLTHSKYGRNGNEISINSYGGYVTGISGNNISNTYETTTGQNASTTGNIYGVYDMSGNAWEYVASYYNGSTNVGNMGLKGASSTEWATAYTGTVASTAYKKGDATYETSGWNGDCAKFVDPWYQVLVRSGSFSAPTEAGLFCFSNGNGNANSYNSFRICLSVE